jgi:hypothetical protein
LTITVTDRANPLAVCKPDNPVLVDAFDVGPSGPPPVAGQRFEETSPPPAITDGADWTQDQDPTKAWSGGTAAVSTTPGAQTTFTFTGTSVSWIGLRGPQTGIARVSLDGAFQAQVDTYYRSEIQARVYSATDLAPAQHTLTIEVAGKNPASSGQFIFVDAFDVGSRFEERDRSVVYTGDWFAPNASFNRPWDTDRAWSGNTANSGPGTAALSLGAVAAAEFTFTGTSVKWISRHGPSDGVADVFLDGVSAGQVNLFSATEQLRVPVFDSGRLATPGPHTLKIAVAGQEAFVVVDAFDVTLPSPGVQVRRFAETDPALFPVYTPTASNPSLGWVQGSGFPFWSGETVMFTDFCVGPEPCVCSAPPCAGPSATFTFTGTSVTWIGDRSQGTGIARVILDEGTAAEVAVEVDTFADVLGDSQTAIFSRSWPTPGTHTLTIEATGLKNARAGGTRIVIDAIDVQD